MVKVVTVKNKEIINPGKNTNYLINGGFQVWQRGTSLASHSAQYSRKFVADRWGGRFDSNGGVYSIIRDSIVLNGVNKTALKVTVDTASTHIGTGATYLSVTPFEQIIEGLFAYELNGKDITVSFWIETNFSGTLCAAIGSSNQGNNYLHEFTVEANVLKKVSFSFKLPNTFVSYSNGTGISVNIGAISQDSYFIGSTANSLIAESSKITTGNCTLWSNNVGSTIKIAEVKLEEGTYASDFEYDLYDQELLKCQRYYEKSYTDGVFEGANTTIGSVEIQNSITGTSPMMTTVFYRTNKRTTGHTVRIYNSAGTINVVDSDPGNVPSLVTGVSTGSIQVYANDAVSNKRWFRFHWAADCEF